IKGNPVVIVLDSGAGISIMTKKLVNKLKLKIQEKSSTVVVTMTGARTRALGKITNLNIMIQNTIIPSTVQVIESSDETLLLGTDWFQKAKARLHFDEQQQEPTKERSEQAKFKEEKNKSELGSRKVERHTDLEWLLNFVEYDEYKAPRCDNKDDKEVEEEWDWWDIDEDEDPDDNGDEREELQLEINSESDQEYTWIRSESEECAIEELNKIHDHYYLEHVVEQHYPPNMNPKQFRQIVNSKNTMEVKDETLYKRDSQNADKLLKVVQANE
ncbi:1147_t:CDS:2, partial [Cetraspora pellucida]